jgi:hypothetical protein
MDSSNREESSIVSTLIPSPEITTANSPLESSASTSVEMAENPVLEKREWEHIIQQEDLGSGASLSDGVRVDWSPATFANKRRKSSGLLDWRCINGYDNSAFSASSANIQQFCSLFFILFYFIFVLTFDQSRNVALQGCVSAKRLVVCLFVIYAANAGARSVQHNHVQSNQERASGVLFIRACKRCQ